MNQFDILFSPITIRGKTYKNRILSAPFRGPQVRADGTPDPENLEIFVGKARGGYAEVCLGETPVNYTYANRSPHDVKQNWRDLSEENIRPWRIIAEGIKSYGAVAMVELGHAGASREMSHLLEVSDSIGPCACTKANGTKVIAMDEALMEETAEDFAACGYFMKQAGFDGVVPHFGHGWLIGQFLSTLTNHRTDEYGGTLENRARFPMMVLRRIRDRCGEDFLISPRISGKDPVPGGITVEEAADFCKMMEGIVDMVNISVGDYRNPIRSREFSSPFHPHAVNADLSTYIKKSGVKMPVSTVGGINSPELASELIKSGACDFVSLGRQGIADPAFPNKIMEGRPEEINRCIRCYRCYQGPLEDVLDSLDGAEPDMRCSLNPVTDRFVEVTSRPKPLARRKVLVVGGGFAGMQAAVTAADRGHQVILCEKTDSFGGLLKFSERDEHKKDIAAFKNSLAARVKNRPIEVRMNTEVTPELIREIAPDGLILATGSTPVVPPIPGIQSALHVLDAYDAPEKVGESVVIIGGGLAGVEAGLYYDARGHRVTVVEMREKVVVDGYPMQKEGVYEALELSSVTCLTGCRCTAIGESEVTCIDRDGCERVLPADTVLFAVGQKSVDTQALKEAAADIPVFLVGDCKAPRKIVEATEEGFDAAYEII